MSDIVEKIIKMKDDHRKFSGSKGSFGLKIGKDIILTDVDVIELEHENIYITESII